VSENPTSWNSASWTGELPPAPNRWATWRLKTMFWSFTFFTVFVPFLMVRAFVSQTILVPLCKMGRCQVGIEHRTAFWLCVAVWLVFGLLSAMVAMGTRRLLRRNSRD
jgi:hypothetical protein